MGETIAVIFGMIFVGIIIICLIREIFQYIFPDGIKPKNNLEENLKKFEEKENGIQQKTYR